MKRLLFALLAGVFVLAFFACDDDIPADPGVDALLQVQGAQFRRGPIPNENGGPAVTAATLRSQVETGSANMIAAGDLERTATAVAIAIEGDIGYWTVPAKVPSSGTPTAPTWSITYGVTPSLLPGTYSYVLRAVDADGHFGPASLHPLTVVPGRVPEGRLVISLAWDTAVDLDLHVLLPTGVEMFKRHRAEYERPPGVVLGAQDPFAIQDGGVIDRDSNAHCVEDGQRAEHAVWVNPPPPGHYQIRVDTFSMCGAPSAHWRLEATLDGQRLGSASGVATENDVRFAHDRGAGVLALEIDVP